MTTESLDAVILFDNESIYNILDKYLELDFIDYNHVNNIISQVISSYTGLQRFNGLSNTKVLNNLLPNRYLSFITPSYGSLSLLNDYQFKELNENALIKQITHKDSKLYQCKEDPIYLSTALLNREQKLNEFYGQFSKPLQKIDHYYEISTKLYQCQVRNYQIIPELKELKQTNIFLSNDTTVKNRFQALIQKFNSIYYKRAFCHWYQGEGMEAREFEETKENIIRICKDYDQFNYQVPCEEDDLDLQD